VIKKFNKLAISMFSNNLNAVNTPAHNYSFWFANTLTFAGIAPKESEFTRKIKITTRQ